MKSSETQKPAQKKWRIEESATHVAVRNEEGDVVFHDDKRIPGVMADARLIEQAPNLLASLRDVIGWVPDASAWHTGAAREAVDKARAVIARATGTES